MCAEVTDEREPREAGGVYLLGKQIGHGSFGQVYRAMHRHTGEQFAVKVEKLSKEQDLVTFESKILKQLSGAPGFTQLHHFGFEDGYYMMVMDLLGPSLAWLFGSHGTEFSHKTVLMLADQMLHRIEYLHFKNIIHRDIKPDNFAIGRGEEASTIHLFDFGLSKLYRGRKSGKHIPFRDDKRFTGTARYASVAAHAGVEQSRRDDLEAIGYMLVFFIRGKLPWQGIKGDEDGKHQKIMEFKKMTSPKALCAGHPECFAKYLVYCRNLPFSGQPDYNYLRQLFMEEFMRKDFVDDGMFDWSQPEGASDSMSWSFGAATSKFTGLMAATGVREIKGSKNATASTRADSGEHGSVNVPVTRRPSSGKTSNAREENSNALAPTHKDSNTLVPPRPLAGRSLNASDDDTPAHHRTVKAAGSPRSQGNSTAPNSEDDELSPRHRASKPAANARGTSNLPASNLDDELLARRRADRAANMARKSLDARARHEAVLREAAKRERARYQRMDRDVDSDELHGIAARGCRNMCTVQ